MDARYHYCTTNTFLAIIESQKIRLSSLLLSNDSLEGKIMARALDELGIEDGLSEGNRRLLQVMLESAATSIDGLGFCTSEEGDLLSQWRGYADDGRGISIGFNKLYLHWLCREPHSTRVHPLMFAPVRYDIEQQKWDLRLFYFALKKRIEEGDFSNYVESKPYNEMPAFFLDHYHALFTLKASGFREEREWRLLTFVGITPPSPQHFRAVSDRLVPFVEQPIIKLDDHPMPPIVDIVLGPKNITPIPVIARFLRLNGFEGVTIRRSQISYR